MLSNLCNKQHLLNSEILHSEILHSPKAELSRNQVELADFFPAQVPLPQ